MLVATSTTADESDCRTVIPSRARDLGSRGEAPPQMLRRCGWLCMTLSEQRLWFFLLEALIQVVYPGGVASGDLRFFLLGAVRQNLLDDLQAPGAGGLLMRIISAPQQLIHPYDVTVPYAQGFVVRRLMNNQPIPILPIFQNIYPPTTPTPKRSYAFGKALRSAIESWDAHKRVPVIASAGMSHFIVDEEIDRLVLKALQEKDARTLCSLPKNRLLSAAAEIKGWVTLGGTVRPPGNGAYRLRAGVPHTRWHGWRMGLCPVAVITSSTCSSQSRK